MSKISIEIGNKFRQSQEMILDELAPAIHKSRATLSKVVLLHDAKKLLAVKGIGIITVAGFLAEVGDLGRFTSPKQI